jgi:hypothetical protein
MVKRDRIVSNPFENWVFAAGVIFWWTKQPMLRLGTLFKIEQLTLKTPDVFELRESKTSLRRTGSAYPLIVHRIGRIEEISKLGNTGTMQSIVKLKIDGLGRL